jgi:cell fate regulator YaaT (PSP1 superfamily)
MIMENKDTLERGICRSLSGSCFKLGTTDWLSDIKNIANTNQLVEIRFKNTRKDYFRNVNDLKLKPGDIVAVEANPGHDIGVVSLVGDLVMEQMKKHKASLINGDFRKVYRKAKPVDIEKWREAIMLEHSTMIKSRQIASDLRLNMKIGDVEYQGDKTKAIFYYIADERVDFRQLIKILAEEFFIRIEMKQIGARQEAGRIGGVGPCGRELCCSTWIGNFISVSTNSARYQDLSMNPQKLAGQCGKLKCCLNFEVDTYLDAQKDFPPTHIPLDIEKTRYIFQKADILGGIYWYSAQNNELSANLVAVPISRVKEIQQLNSTGKRPEKLVGEGNEKDQDIRETFQNMAGQESINRFDKPENPRKRKKNFRRQNIHRSPR